MFAEVHSGRSTTYLNYFFLAQAILFCTARTTDVQAPKNPFLFEAITAQRKQSYNLSSGYFTPPVNGIYVIHLSSAVPGGEKIYFFMQLNNTLNFGIYRTSTSHNGIDTTSRDFISSLKQGAQINLNLQQGTANAGTRRRVSWSAFLLDNIMYPLVTFCVGRDNSLSSTGWGTFNKIITQNGNAWNTSTNTFTAPRNGSYVFSLSCGIESGQFYQVYVIVNDVVSYGLYFTSTSHNGIDTASRTFATSLVAGDRVDVWFLDNIPYSDSNYLTSFAGFLYEPINSSRKVIWSVHQTTSSSGAFNPLPFDYESINIGGGWNKNINKVILPYAGVYQLHLTATSQANGQIDYQVMLNDASYANILIYTTTHNGYETRSRAIMIEATAGDVLHISTSDATKLFSNIFRLTSFTGFLLST